MKNCITRPFLIVPVLLGLSLGCSDRSVTPSKLASAEKGGDETPNVIDDADHLTINPSDIVLGNVFIGETKSFTATISNTTSHVINIDSLHAACGCTSIEVSKHVLDPSETVNLTGSFRAGAEAGLFRKPVTVTFSGLSTAPATAVVKGCIMRQINFSPSCITLSPDVVERKPGITALRIENHSSSSVSLEKINGLPSNVQAELPQSPMAPGSGCDILFSVPLNNCVDYYGDVILSCSHTDESHIKIPIEIRPVHSILATPDRISLGVVSRQELLSRQEFHVALTGDLAGSADVQNIKTPSFIKVVSRSRNPSGDGFTLGFCFADSLDHALLNESILIHATLMGGACETTIAIPVSGLVKDGQTDDK